ncbi:hypothetical protein ACS0TY_004057 [Phlomoides rotata]
MWNGHLEFSKVDLQLWQIQHVFGVKVICMHNMIIKNERVLDAPIEVAREVPSSNLEFVENEPDRFQNFMDRFRQIRNAEAHYALRNALIDHF